MMNVWRNLQHISIHAKVTMKDFCFIDSFVRNTEENEPSSLHQGTRVEIRQIHAGSLSVDVQLYASDGQLGQRKRRVDTATFEKVYLLDVDTGRRLVESPKHQLVVRFFNKLGTIILKDARIARKGCLMGIFKK
ncbi:hypothetical protein BJX99DRAFT_238626 [Aspergillus californicus]